MDDDQLSEIRSRYLGFIFQSYNLLPQYTVVENIEIPLLYQGMQAQRSRRANGASTWRSWSAWATGSTIARCSCPAASSSAWPSPAPWSTIRTSSSPTSRPATSTRTPATRSCELLAQLNDAGKTIIMVTHENDIAAWAQARHPHARRPHRDGRTQSTRVGQAAAAVVGAARCVGRCQRRRCCPRLRERRSILRRSLTACLPAGALRRSSTFAASYRSFYALHLSADACYWDKGGSSFVLALRSLWLHKLRSFLSVLGIIIGTGAVIALMAFGEGSMQDALEDIRRQGRDQHHRQQRQAAWTSSHRHSARVASSTA